MAVLVVGLVLFLSMVVYSDANYCLCNPQLSDTVLQTNIDYACGNGADCSQILQNGPCFNPNTVKDHCNYAVNSYYQRKLEVPGSCVFSNTTFVSANPPSTSGSCVYQSSPGGGGSTTPGTPTNPGTPSTPGTPGTPGTPTNPGTGTVPGSSLNPGGGISIAPSGGFDNTGNGASPELLSRITTFMLVFLSIALLISKSI